MKLSLKGLKFLKNLDLLSGLIFVVLAGLFIDVVSTKEATALTWRSRPVSWTSLVGVSVDGNNTLKKTAATGWGNSGAASVQTILADGEVEFLVNEINTSRICGLSYNNTNSNYDTIDYGILLNYTFNNITNTSAYNLEVYERGIKRDVPGNLTFASGEHYSVERAANTINYKRNGSTFYTSTASTGPLLVDAALNTTTGTIASAQVMAPNNPPVAYNQNLNTTQNTALYNINLNATDLDNDSLNYTIVNNPVNGNLTGTPPLNMTYTPNTNFYGLDGFSFKAYDGFDYSNIANVNIDITQVNNPPNPPIAIYPMDNATAIPILDTTLNWACTDPDLGDTLTYDLYFGNQTAPPLLEANIINPYYALNPLLYNTTYYWKIKAIDNHGNWTQGPEWDFRTEIIVPPNTPPVAISKSSGTWVDTQLNITLEATDNNGDSLQYFIVDQPQHGILSGTPPAVTFTPITGYEGPDRFTFKAFDGRDYSNTAIVYLGVYENFAWSSAERLDTYTSNTGGTQPRLAYAPSGDLRVFYNFGTTYNLFLHNMVVRKRLHNQSVFEPEVFVYDHARTATIHYDSIDANKIDLAVGTEDETAVLESQDNGNSWSYVTSFDSWNDGIGGSHDAYTTSGFTEDDSQHLRLFYSYMDWHAGFQDPLPHLRYAERINNTWNTAPILDEPADISGTYENEDNVCIFSAQRYFFSYISTDNGATFDLMSTGEDADMDLGNQGRIYRLVHIVYWWENPIRSLMLIKYSDDDGVTWHIIDQASYFVFAPSEQMFIKPRFAVNGNVIVIAWAHEDTPDYPKSIQSVISKDGGLTWSPVQTVVSVVGAEEIRVAHTAAGSQEGSPLDIENYDNKFSLSYSVTDHNALYRYGVFLKEINVQGWDTNHAPVLAPIGNKAVYAGYNLTFDVSATDEDPGDNLTLIASPLPQGASFVDHGNGTGTFSWTPGPTQARTYSITFTASDGTLEDTEDVIITVTKSGGGGGKKHVVAPIE